MTTETSGKNVPARTRPQGISDLREEIDRLWETMLASPWRPFQSLSKQRPLPAIDVFEKDGQLHIRAELPGMTDKDIQVELAKDTITISGEKKEEHEVKEENYYKSERTYGSFRRQVALPAGADQENVQAQFKDGVLKIDVPIREAKPEAKKIEIKPGP
jgi:HSP20 family protein